MGKTLLKELPVGYGMTGKEISPGVWDTWDGSQCGCGPLFCANRVGCKDGRDVMVFDGYEMHEGGGYTMRFHMEPQPEKKKRRRKT